MHSDAVAILLRSIWIWEKTWLLFLQTEFNIGVFPGVGRKILYEKNCTGIVPD